MRIGVTLPQTEIGGDVAVQSVVSFEFPLTAAPTRTVTPWISASDGMLNP
jgi:hypothetical protein